MSTEVALVVWWVLFGGSHLSLSSRPVRGRLMGSVGVRAFKGIYSLVALVTIVGLFWTYFHGKHEGTLLFARTFAARHVTETVMLFAVLFIAFAHGSRSPATTQADMTGERPSSATGIHRITRHPQDTGFALFGLAHMLVNTSVGDWIFWGGFPVFAIVASIHQDRRMLASGSAEFRSFHEQTSFLPFAAILAGKQKIVWSEFRWRTLLIGLVLYGVLRGIHPFVMGGFGG
jgi:uncharacterized membrane protein